MECIIINTITILIFFTLSYYVISVFCFVVLVVAGSYFLYSDALSCFYDAFFVYCEFDHHHQVAF